jgi:hypothetical protein
VTDALRRARDDVRLAGERAVSKNLGHKSRSWWKKRRLTATGRGLKT